MIGLKCPKCQAVMKVDEAQAGTVSSCPGCGVTCGGTISLPVAMTATRGRRCTSTRLTPMPASAPTSCARQRCPAGKRRHCHDSRFALMGAIVAIPRAASQPGYSALRYGDEIPGRHP